MIDMENQFIKAIDEAIKQVIRDFQDDSNRYWNERDIHWSLLYHLKNQTAFQRGCVTEIIRAEFPTRKVYRGEDGGKGARGHYDLVVLDPESLNKPAVRAMTPWTPWSECIHLMEVVVAVEAKVWWYRWKPIKRRVEWDIEKLTCSENAVKQPYFLNFVGCGLERMRDYYFELRECLAKEVKQHPQLKVLCVPSDAGLQAQGDYWLSASE
jgi:hypothetical protein